MRTTLVIVLTMLLVNGLLGQDQKSSFNRSYYKLDNLDSLKSSSLDSIRGKLIYYMLESDSIRGFIFPITIYKTYDDWTNENVFNLFYRDNYLFENLEIIGKLDVNGGCQYSDLRFFKNDDSDYKRAVFLDSTRRISILFKGDSLFVNDSLFKKDKTGRIFQKFTGY